MFGTKDIKEIVNKKGKIIAFCNFEDMLLDAFNCSNKDQLSQFAGYNGEYVIHCPFCKESGDHSKHKLYIKETLDLGYCFTCGRSYVNVDDEIKFDVRPPEFTNSLGISMPFSVYTLDDDGDWGLNTYRYESSPYDKDGLDYLIGRHKYMADIYKIIGIKFYEGNPIIPFRLYGNGDVFYYQMRFANKSASKIRYFHPNLPGRMEGEKSGKKPPYVIAKEVEDRTRLIFCEGIFDAISMMITCPSAIPIAVLGSHITDYQMDYIRQFVTPTQILVYMDDYKLSSEMVARLKSKFDYCSIDIVPSYDEMDPEEKMKEIMYKNPGFEIGWLEKYFEKPKPSTKISVPVWKGF